MTPVMKFSSLLTSLLSVLLVASFEKPISNSYSLTSSDLGLLGRNRHLKVPLRNLKRVNPFIKKNLKTELLNKYLSIKQASKQITLAPCLS